ncbi:MAG: SRPBCC family protein [Candidatus Omnitrophica bacterium]|nr:SRPBCC family protein [Candidatus Omnitrophota bacterium]
MGHTCNSITIDAPYDLIFDISNHIERWTELFGDEYISAEVLSREGNRIEFRLTDKDGNSWTSFRLLYKEHNFAYAQKNEPTFPFKYMKIMWLYTPLADGVKMTWIQDFEMDPKFEKFTDEQIVGFVNEHSQHNMNIFKDVIEKEAQELAAKG